MPTFEARITKEQYNPNGYQEDQADKTTYFSWEEVPHATPNTTTQA